MHKLDVLLDKRQTRQSVEKTMPQQGRNAEKVDPRVLRSKKLLADAFRSLLSEDSYANVSVAEIAERAKVNRGTFYAHCTEKEDLAKAIVREDLFEALSPYLSPKAPLDAEHLTTVGEALFNCVGKLLLSCPTQVDAFLPVLSQTIQEALQSLVADWLDRDPTAMERFRSNDKEAITTVIAWSLYGGALTWITYPKRPPARQAVQEIVTLLIQ